MNIQPGLGTDQSEPMPTWCRGWARTPMIMLPVECSGRFRGKEVRGCSCGPPGMGILGAFTGTATPCDLAECPCSRNKLQKVKLTRCTVVSIPFHCALFCFVLLCLAWTHKSDFQGCHQQCRQHCQQPRCQYSSVEIQALVLPGVPNPRPSWALPTSFPGLVLGAGVSPWEASLGHTMPTPLTTCCPHSTMQ